MTSCTSSSRTVTTPRDGGEPGGQPVGVGLLADPGADCGHLDAGELVAHHAHGEEFSEKSPAVAEHVLFVGMIAVWIGAPAGGGRAVTANQSASLPTMPASAIART
jgi:hypothetical protein